MRALALALLALALLLPGAALGEEEGGSASAQAPRPGAKWGYGQEDGPARWGALDPAWSLCATGQRQSPIDIRGARLSPLAAFSVRRQPVTLRIIHQEHVVDVLNNGHTIQINAEGEDSLTLGDTRFDRVQSHFHAPSEHTLEGRRFPMEMHVVHQSKDGRLAVVGIFIEEGEPLEVFDVIWTRLPQRKGVELHVEDVEIDLDDFLPSVATSYRYVGSLTTPPCSETVSWIVAAEPIQLSRGQIDAFRAIFDGNSRPVQPLNGRRITTDVATTEVEHR